MAFRKRQGFDPKAGFKKPQDPNTVHAALLKNARASGQLNLSGRSLSEGNHVAVGRGLILIGLSKLVFILFIGVYS